MRLRFELSLGLGALLALQLLTAFAAIGLLSRVSPAVAQIIDDNVYSIEAVEEMLAVLAGDPTQTAAAERFYGAHERAASNVTEDAERPLLAAVLESAPDALEDDPEARAETITALRELGRVNRVSMADQDLQAQRIGITGAWAAVMLGVVTSLFGAMVYRRLRTRMEDSLLEVDAALRAARGGDTLRRCASVDAPEEIVRIADNVNWTLDHILAPGANPIPEEHAALLVLLDRQPGPAALLDGDRVLGANSAAIDRIASGDRPGGGDDWEVVEVSGTTLRLCFALSPS